MHLQLGAHADETPGFGLIPAIPSDLGCNVR